MITNIPVLPGYTEVIEDTPIILTVPATARQIYQGVASKWVTSYLIRVRSMGTATYIRVGNYYAQHYSLTSVGDTKGFTCEDTHVLDMTKVWIVSDTADAVVEVVCSFIPVKPQGNVIVTEDM
jgi:hypothetical protein